MDWEVADSEHDDDCHQHLGCLPASSQLALGRRVGERQSAFVESYAHTRSDKHLTVVVMSISKFNVPGNVCNCLPWTVKVILVYRENEKTLMDLFCYSIATILFIKITKTAAEEFSL